jgi:hypothetical protein
MHNKPHSRPFPHSTVAAAALLALLSILRPTSAQTSEQLSRPVEQTPGQQSDLVRHYRTHIEFLADPKLEGRGPGTHGNEVAAGHIEHAFRSLGLRPGFAPDKEPPPPDAGPYRFRESFTAGNGATQRGVELRGGMDADSLPGGAPNNVRALGFSASADITAPVVFAGYSIGEGGPDKSYSSYPKENGEKPLEGKIALILRFEPMDADGRSLWKKKEDTLWTASAALPDKIAAAIKHGAAGILLASPPNCDDARARKLESAEATARWMRTLEVPAVMLSAEAADALVRARDPKHRSLLQLRRLADERGELIPLGTSSITLSAKIDRSPRTTWNIAATLPGRGALADQYIIIGAHYDHVGYGYTGGSRSDEYGIVHPGADDNASGAAGLLLAAEIMAKKYDADPKESLRSIMFVAFSAEEMGLIGSREFLKACPVDAKRIDCMLNMDMIGRLRENKLEVSGTGTAEDFADLLKPLFDSSGLLIQASPGGRGPSDHATFYGAGIPVLHFFTGNHEQYHTPRDTVDLINVEGAVRVVNLVCAIANSLASREQQLAFTSTDKTKGADEEPGKPRITLDGPGGMKVRFGIAPGNYSDGEAGVLVGEVFPGTCAAEAGIQPGDRLTRWNGHEIGDVKSWMEMMSSNKPGDVVDVDVKRGKEEIRVRATLKSRDQAPK